MASSIFQTSGIILCEIGILTGSVAVEVLISARQRIVADIRGRYSVTHSIISSSEISELMVKRL